MSKKNNKDKKRKCAGCCKVFPKQELVKYKATLRCEPCHRSIFFPSWMVFASIILVVTVVGFVLWLLFGEKKK